MSRLSSMLLTVVVLALMGLARLPVPCVGDGQGHPCSIEQCACTKACTCKLSCQRMQATPGGHHACHMAGMASSAAPEHFSLPDAPPPTALGGILGLFPGAHPEPGRLAPAPSRDAPCLPRPEPPPRQFA